MEAGAWIDQRYRVLRPLGNGSEGSVFLAVQECICRFCAVKVLRKEGCCFSRQSIELWKRLSHPGLPQIIDVIEEEKRIYLIMEYIEGKNLEEIVKEKGKMPERKVLSWGIEICNVLEYLHGQTPPVIFGDIKPSNLILCGKNIVMVDLGSAAMQGSMARMTGTAAYSPVLQSGGEVCPEVKNDIYGLGRTLEYLLSGEYPSGERAQRGKGSISKEIRRILDRCISGEDPGRFYSVTQCREQLRRLKKRPLRVGGMGAAAITSLILAAFTLKKAEDIIDGEAACKQLIEEARTAPPGERRQLLEMAVRADPYSEQGYLELLEYFLEDAVLSEEEDLWLRTLMQETWSGREKTNEQILAENPAGYGAVAYEIGMAYWYFYEGYSGEKYAAVWFEKVCTIPREVHLGPGKRQKSRIYKEIIAYRSKLEQSRISGEEVSYEKYWSDLMELRQISGKEPDGEITWLYFCRELAEQMAHYMLEFKNAGVTGQEMKAVAEQLTEEIDNMGTENMTILELKEQTAAILDTLPEMYERIYASDRTDNQMRGEELYESY